MSHNVPFTTLQHLHIVESAYVFYECRFTPAPLRGRSLLHGAANLPRNIDRLLFVHIECQSTIRSSHTVTLELCALAVHLSTARHLAYALYVNVFICTNHLQLFDFFALSSPTLLFGYSV